MTRRPTIAIIPARGGSKGIPRKNLLEVGGRPLIEWSIRSALEAISVERVILTTDDPEIADVGRRAGAEVPFERPADLAGDLVPDLPVFQHVLSWLHQHESFDPGIVVHLRPTSPARRPGLVDDAVALLASHPEASSVRSVTRPLVTPYKMWHFAGEWLEPVVGTIEAELFNEPRQALPPVWVHEGTVDVIRSEVILGGSMTGLRILGLALPAEEAVDLDEFADLPRVEAALARLHPPRTFRET